MNRKGGQEAVEIVAVFVQLALLPRYGELTFVCPPCHRRNTRVATVTSPLFKPDPARIGLPEILAPIVEVRDCR